MFDLNNHIQNQLHANDNNPLTKRVTGVFDGVYCDVIYNIEPWEVNND
jgi:hypothetical protein